MDEAENEVKMNEVTPGENNEGTNASSENCTEENEALLEQEDENVAEMNNISNDVNNDETSAMSSDSEELNPVTANNLSNNLGGGGSIAASAPPPKRYMQVEGFDGRLNDIVYCRPLTSTNSKTVANSSLESEAEAHTSSGGDENHPKLMLFFGGDIQDFPEMMEQHRDHRNYVAFNLEATAVMLQKQFPDHHIAVVRPSRIQMLTFSCYDNFVHCNHTGAPEHVITHHSLHHLQLLIKNLSRRLSSSSSTNDEGNSLEDSPKNVLEGGGNSTVGNKVQVNDEDATVSSTTVDDSSSTTTGTLTITRSRKNKPSLKKVQLERASISLIGFSKGCVVLNQLLYEFHYLKTLTPDDLTMDEFLSCIKDMYWLDGGHNGGKNTWITSRSLLETLTRLGVRIHVHLTPYQLLDDRRPWIRKEEKLFSELLKKFNAPITRQIHFENEPATLLQHLRIIGDFTSETEEDSKLIDDPDPLHENNIDMEH